MGCPAPISARPSMAGGTQDLVTAAQAATDEAVGRFAPYAEYGVLTFGGDSALFGGLDSFELSGMTTLSWWRRSTYSRTRRLEGSTLLLLHLRLLLGQVPRS